MRTAIALLLTCLSYVAHADVFRSAYLELREAEDDRYDVLWKVPAQGDMRQVLNLRLPDDSVQVTKPQRLFDNNAYIERWQIHRSGGLAGQAIAVQGIVGGATDVIVRIERKDGTSQVEHLLPQKPQFIVQGTTGAADVAWTYLVLGIQHILNGIDHLLFVLALLLIVRGGKRILLTVTAFTVAHSLTLVAATLGWVHVPGPPVEATIALSIVFVAVEIVHGLQDRPGLTARAPWVVAFSFGLLHGFGFAGALAEVGLPQKAIPIALLMFNVGVEFGQLIFVLVALAAAVLLARLPLRQRGRMRYAASYAIGSIAMFWVIGRLAAFT